MRVSPAPQVLLALWASHCSLGNKTQKVNVHKLERPPLLCPLKNQEHDPMCGLYLASNYQTLSRDRPWRDCVCSHALCEPNSISAGLSNLLLISSQDTCTRSSQCPWPHLFLLRLSESHGYLSHTYLLTPLSECFFFVLGPQPVALTVYYWLCTQKSPLAG